MKNNNTHHFKYHVFSHQSHTAIVQQFSTSSLVRTDADTEIHHPAGKPRISPLDAEAGISRALARHPADHKTGRPNTAPTHTQLREQGRGSLLQIGEGVPPIRSHSNPTVTPGTTRRGPSAGDNPHTVAKPQEREVPIGPDSNYSSQKPVQRPPRGVRQDKARLESARTASRQPARMTEVTRAPLTNNSVVRSQNSPVDCEKGARSEPAVLVISPDAQIEDPFKDLYLWQITEQTMLTLEQRLKIHVPFIATEHNDHTGNRHVHLLACAKARIERQDLKALRDAATEAALDQRHERDLAHQGKLHAIEEVQWA